MKEVTGTAKIDNAVIPNTSHCESLFCMLPSQHAKLIQEILDKPNSNLAAETDNGKLEIYRLALEGIKKGLEERKPRDLAQETLIDYEDALQEISVACYGLRTKPIGKTYKLDEDVVPHLDDALAYLSRALVILEGVEKSLEYLQCLLRFRNLIFQICRYLEPGSNSSAQI